MVRKIEVLNTSWIQSGEKKVSAARIAPAEKRWYSDSLINCSSANTTAEESERSTAKPARVCFATSTGWQYGGPQTTIGRPYWAYSRNFVVKLTRDIISKRCSKLIMVRNTSADAKTARSSSCEIK